jgi:hypothetical protein
MMMAEIFKNILQVLIIINFGINVREARQLTLIGQLVPEYADGICTTVHCLLPVSILVTMRFPTSRNMSSDPYMDDSWSLGLSW